jgi:hypothetical protein
VNNVRVAWTRTPMDFAPIAEQFRLLKEAPRRSLPAPSTPVAPPALGHLRESLQAFVTTFERIGPGYSTEAPVGVFVAQSATTGALFRLRAISELLEEGVCGLVAASMARSLLDDAAMWAWVAEDPDRLDSAGDYLAAEWARITLTAAQCDIPEKSLERWLAPSGWVGRVSTTGAQTPFPGTHQILKRLSDPMRPTPDPALPLRLTGIGTMGALLAQCGHFSRYAALLCPFAWDLAAVDFDTMVSGGRLIPELEAVVIHVAAASTFATCVVTAWADPDPTESTLEVLSAVSAVMDEIHSLAPTIHGMVAEPARLFEVWTLKQRPDRCRQSAPSPAVVEPAHRWAPPAGANIEEVRAAACKFFDVATGEGPLLVAIPPVSSLRYVALPLLASTFWSLRTLAHKVNTTSVAAHAARQLLEEGAKWRWAQAGADTDESVARKETLIGEIARARDAIAKRAKSEYVSEALGPFLEPSGLDIDELCGRFDSHKAPTLDEVWDAASTPSRGIGGSWTRLAYSLLSQATHHTPMGALHTVELEGSTVVSGSVSPQFEALSLDAGCLGAVWLWTGLAPLLIGAPTIDGDEFDPYRYREWAERVRAAYRQVHAAAAPLHGLLGRYELSQVGRNESCPCGSGSKAKFCHLR